MAGDNIMVATDRGRYGMLNPAMVKDKCKERQCYSFTIVCASLKSSQGKLVFWMHMHLCACVKAKWRMKILHRFHSVSRSAFMVQNCMSISYLLNWYLWWQCLNRRDFIYLKEGKEVCCISKYSKFYHSIHPFVIWTKSVWAPLAPSVRFTSVSWKKS